MALKIKILFDNTAIDRRFIPLWGFSATVEFDNFKFLFDTGSNGRILLENAKKLSVDFKQFDYLFISHPHWDHVGGIDSVLELNPKLTLILPKSISSHWIEDLKKFSSNIIVVDKPKEIFPNIASTGVDAPEGEHSLVFNTNKGLVIITGCGHQGVLNIVNSAQKIFNKPVFYLIGGFHLLHHSEQEIISIAKNLNFKYITPTHCSGSLAQKIFKRLYPDKFIEGGVGKIIEFEQLEI